MQERIVTRTLPHPQMAPSELHSSWAVPALPQQRHTLNDFYFQGNCFWRDYQIKCQSS